jgi:hypothetical protein
VTGCWTWFPACLAAQSSTKHALAPSAHTGLLSNCTITHTRRHDQRKPEKHREHVHTSLLAIDNSDTITTAPLHALQAACSPNCMAPARGWGPMSWPPHELLPPS